MDWDDPESSASGDESLGAGSAASEGDAAALGLDKQPPEFYDAEADERDAEWMAKMRGARTSDAILSCPLCFTTLCIDCQQHDTYDNQFRAALVMNCKVKTGQVVVVPAKPSKRERRRQRQQQAAQQQASAEQPDGAHQPGASAPAAQQPDRGQQPGASAPAQQPPQCSLEQAAERAAGQPQLRPQQQPPPGEQLNPVCCAVCDTEVGLRDTADGLYHFFNCFASNP